MDLILASNSPRRKEILANAGYSFTVKVSNFEEIEFSLDPVQTATAFALGKAKDVFDGLQVKKGKVVLGADTVVFYQGQLLGKPTDKENARHILKTLSGKTHSVVTGYAIVTEKGIKSGYSLTEVTFNMLSDQLIKEYIDSGLCMDKAGAYGIQDGYNLVKEYKGSLNNVIGLPIEDIKPILDTLI